MNILITGGTGFLGKHIVAKLSQEPDCQIYAPSSSSLDLTSRSSTYWAIDELMPDVILHMAALCGGILG